MNSKELKFRVWSLKNKYFVTRGAGLPVLLSLMYEGAVKDEDIYQIYTGLKDINGSEIYEGDVLEYDDEILRDDIEVHYFQGEYWTDSGESPFKIEKRKFLMKRDNDQFFIRSYIGWFRTNAGEENGKVVEGLLNGGGSKHWVIKGNVLENPELLNVL